jgi:hypothetical protein
MNGAKNNRSVTNLLLVVGALPVLTKVPFATMLSRMAADLSNRTTGAGAC